MERYQKRFLQLVLLLVIGLIVIVPTIIWLAPKAPHEYEGVVIQGKPDIAWIKQGNYYSRLETVKVFSRELGIVNVVVHDSKDLGSNHYFDQNLISYRDSYPPALGKTIKVKFNYNNKRELIITKAWTE